MKLWLGTMVALLAFGVAACGDDEDTSSGGGSANTRTAAILALTGSAADGATVYTSNCGQSSCHGSDGSGSSSNARDLNTVVPSIDDSRLVDVILDGASTGGAVMPGLGSLLDDQEVADVVAYCNETFQ